MKNCFLSTSEKKKTIDRLLDPFFGEENKKPKLLIRKTLINKIQI